MNFLFSAPDIDFDAQFAMEVLRELSKITGTLLLIRFNVSWCSCSGCALNLSSATYSSSRRRTCVQTFVIAFTYCAHDIFASSLSKKLLRMLYEVVISASLLTTSSAVSSMVMKSLPIFKTKLRSIRASRTLSTRKGRTPRFRVLG
jgi:hypothetical protein